MIELSEIRTILGDLGDLDDRLPEARATAIAHWEKMTDALWEARTGYVRVYRRAKSDTLWLPLVSLSAVTVESKYLAADSYVALVADTDFFQDDAASIASLTRITPNGAWDDFVRVTMTGGLTPATTPSDIKHALAMEVGFILYRWAPSKMIAESFSLGEGTSNFLRSAAGMTATNHPIFTEAAARYRVIQP